MEPDGLLHASVDALRRILRELRVIARKTELAAGLSAAQVFVLATLARRPSMSVNEIAEATMTDRSSAAAVVDRLVELGYAKREQSAEDRRRAAIFLSTAGRRALRDASPPPTAVLIAAIEQLSVADRKHLARGLTALTRTMGIAQEPAGMLFEEVAFGSKARRNRAHRRIP
jgi:MarR family transcriptional regulator, lower aerobic nicotinate degradation pathway regulator